MGRRHEAHGACGGAIAAALIGAAYEAFVETPLAEARRLDWQLASGALAHTRYLVSGAAFVALVWRDDARVTFCVVGAVVNSLANKGLKRLFDQARPPGSPLHDPGMPSSHASSLFFFAAYLALALASGVARGGILGAAALLALAGVAAVWRVSAGFHTRSQVAVGACVGSAAAAAWWAVARPRLEATCAGQGAALAVAGVVGVGVLAVSAQEARAARLYSLVARA
ncbi:hypothetical protein T492DRAFT_977899 [Pavlovales sp. CCMP2436]|nr:hypothetical protein T492DRAFT_977899 [Pavlovales sp. CCMP2436]